MLTVIGIDDLLDGLKDFVAESVYWVPINREENGCGEIRYNVKMPNAVGVIILICPAPKADNDSNPFGYLKLIYKLRNHYPDSVINVIQVCGMFARNDRRSGAIRPISSVLICDLLKKAGASQIFTIDPHNSVADSKCIDSWEVFVKQHKLDEHSTIISPDRGMIDLCDNLSISTGSKLIVIDKIRHSNSIKSTVLSSINRRDGDREKYYLLDDMVDSGSTVINALNAARAEYSETLVLTSHQIRNKDYPFRVHTVDKNLVVSEIINAIQRVHEEVQYSTL